MQTRKQATNRAGRSTGAHQEVPKQRNEESLIPEIRMQSGLDAVVVASVAEGMRQFMSQRPIPLAAPQTMNQAMPSPAPAMEFSLPKDREVIVNAHKHLHDRYQSYKLEFDNLLATPPSAASTYMQVADNLMNATFEYISAAENFIRSAGIIRGA